MLRIDSVVVVGILLTSFQLTAWGAIVSGDEIIPPLDQIKKNRPRLLLRPHSSPFAISLYQLQSAPEGEEYNSLLVQLGEQENAAAQAMVWLLTGDDSAADQAVRRMLSYEEPEEYNTFHIHSRLTEFGLAYDWLFSHKSFTPEVREEIRRRVMPIAWKGYRNSNDHMFHNYVWMSAGASALWALATAGEDVESDRLFNALAQRFNEGLFPAMRYLDGLPSEPLGYWFYYDFHPCMFLLLATQSAFERDIVGLISREQGNWVERHFRTIVHGVLPDMRFIPWGDLQSGSNGGITVQAAGMIDAMTWVLDSHEGAWLSRWLAGKQGLQRFRGWTPIFFMIYSRNLDQEAHEPALSYLAGNHQAGQFIARSGWEGDSTIVAFRSTDHYGDHNHHDQGSFIIYREGLLAVDPPVYRKVRGPQEPTSVHNTLLLDGRGQRDCRGQTFPTVQDFEEHRTGTRGLETGDILFYIEEGSWAGIAGQFAQSYEDSLVDSCVRQILFLRPSTILILDHLKAPTGSSLPRVDWLLQVPNEPRIRIEGVSVSNGRSWLKLVPETLDLELFPPAIQPTEVNSFTVSLTYEGKSDEPGDAGDLLIFQRIEVGPESEQRPSREAVISRRGSDYFDVGLSGRAFRFNLKSPYSIQSCTWWH